jgi:hypothetical protein
MGQSAFFITAGILISVMVSYQSGKLKRKPPEGKWAGKASFTGR